MSAKDLVKFWELRDNSRLTSKQMSIRLPTHVAARISALCDVFPNKSKTQLIGDLLSSALDEVENGMSYALSEEPTDKHPETGELLYSIIGEGLKGRYLNSANKYLKELESESGNDNPELFSILGVSDEGSQYLDTKD